MGTSVFFGNRRGSELKLKPGDLEQIGVTASGPVLSGQLSVHDASEKTLLEAQRRVGERETEWWLRRAKSGS